MGFQGFVNCVACSAWVPGTMLLILCGWFLCGYDYAGALLLMQVPMSWVLLVFHDSNHRRNLTILSCPDQGAKSPQPGNYQVITR